MVEQKATNVVWHHHAVTTEDRLKLNGHRGVVIWYTGLSGSGKSTLANAVAGALYEKQCQAYVLDGDNIRHGLNKDLGFSPEDRNENIRRIGEVAHLFADAGIIAMTAFISPYRADRQRARELNPDGGFIEVYCECPLDVCEQRDPKGLYQKARAGQIKEFTGIDAPYEAPEIPEVTVNTGTESPEESVAKVIAYLQEQGIVRK